MTQEKKNKARMKKNTSDVKNATPNRAAWELKEENGYLTQFDGKGIARVTIGRL